MSCTSNLKCLGKRLIYKENYFNEVATLHVDIVRVDVRDTFEWQRCDKTNMGDV